MEIQDIKIFYSNDSLQVFISFYITKKTVYMITKKLTPMLLPFRKNVFKRKKKKRKLKLRYIERQHKSLIKLSHLNYWYWTKKQFKYANNNKQVLLTLLDKTKIRKNLYFNKLKSNKTNSLKKFQEILTDGLLKYTKNKVNIYVTLQNLNYSKQLSNTQIKNLKIIFKQLKRFVRNSFFKEAVNIFFISISKRKSAKLLATFISNQFKLNQLRVNQVSIARKDNYFMGFIKQTITLLLKSDVSCLTGVKIVVKGRFNKAPRARTRHIQCGKFSLQSINSKVSYFQSTAYTVNGTFGVKV
jgi:ribosomal protein S3